MYTQLFGQYLLSSGTVTAAQLSEALSTLPHTKVKLGTLAVAAGYMNAGQVELIHEIQKSRDKCFGDIAKEMGFLSDEQIDELLDEQEKPELVLGQALTDLGYLDSAAFEHAVTSYRLSSEFVDERSDDASMRNEIIRILDIADLEDKDIYAGYLLLLIRNVIRFLGEDFTFGKAERLTDVVLEHASKQDIIGGICLRTVIGGASAPTAEIASRYAGEYLNEADDYAETCMGEFLNLQNGLFIVNMSEKINTVIDLKPQNCGTNVRVRVPENGISIKLSFSFGTLYMMLFRNK